MRIPSGTVDQYIYFVAFDATDFTTRETGLATWTVRRSRNGAASAAFTTPTINETDVTNMPGVYELLLDEDMTLDAGDDSQEVCLHITHAGMAPVTRTFELYRAKITAGEALTVSSGVASANAVQVSGDATAADTLELFAEALDQSTGQLDSGSLAAGAITAATIANAAIDAATFAADVDAEILSYLVDDATRIDASALNTATVTTVPAILADTGTDGVVVASLAANSVTAAALAADAGAEIADAVLNRDLSTGTDSGSTTVRTMRQALRFLRNKWSISGSTLTVNKEDDSTPSWTSELTTSGAAEPVTASDPAGP